MLAALTIAMVTLTAVAQDGVLVLTNGTRIAGKVQKTKTGWKINTHSRQQTFATKEVERFVSKQELKKQLLHLGGLTGSDSPFRTAQRAIWAFENGLDADALDLYGQIVARRIKPASMAKLERLAAQYMLDHARYPTDRVQRARQLLLKINVRKKDAVARAKQAAIVQAMRMLLTAEQAEAARLKKQRATTKRGTKTVANVCRKFAAEAVHRIRRRMARKALLGFDQAGKRFVWRQAILWPQGPTRVDVVSEIRDASQHDDAAVYLTRWLNRGKATLKLRSARVLGDLGSSKALPALHAMRKSIRKSVAKRRRGAGAGATRGHVAFTEQRSVISDFNVEIAQGAAIADPVVTTVQSGVVLDVTIGGIQWDRYILMLDRAVTKSIHKIESAGNASDK
jgi:hypothetical protein